MILSFRNEGTRDIWELRDSRAARKTCPNTLWAAAIEKLNLLNRAGDVEDLRAPPGNRLGVLRGNRAGEHSIRINGQYRICFRWMENGLLTSRSSITTDPAAAVKEKRWSS